MDAINIRPAKDEDRDAIIKLIGGCFCEYEGCVLDLDGIDHAMLNIDTYVKNYEGAFWLAEGEGGKVIGSVGYIIEDGKMELIKLYVTKLARRKGLASKLLQLVLDAASEKNLPLELWSDTRFKEAHKFYTAHGFEKLNDTRDLHDPSNTTEYHFHLP